MEKGNRVVGLSGVGNARRGKRRKYGERYTSVITGDESALKDIWVYKLNSNEY